MSYQDAFAARVDENNVVQEVIVIPYMQDDDATITAYCNSIGIQGKWLDCSFTGSRRGSYPGTGFIYDPDADEFRLPARLEE